MQLVPDPKLKLNGKHTRGSSSALNPVKKHITNKIVVMPHTRDLPLFVPVFVAADNIALPVNIAVARTKVANIASVGMMSRACMIFGDGMDLLVILIHQYDRFTIFQQSVNSRH